ncbi:hypothetical protein PGTUg99_002551 [Puccinia graminis f. sp. tritici]|uniref:Uncharacterized protein n=1 Tax=Puccinia graminis f. sp. tritici TaxID=56615 RepID=A0A5B0PW02_PUCGR|nr:hypothetical protein PGTUg99_002551 [Puccinia graminis f. sp. tritici]
MRFATLFQCLVVALIQGESAFGRSVDTCLVGQYKMCEQKGAKFILTEPKHDLCPAGTTTIKCCSYNNPGTFPTQAALNRSCNGE